MIDDRIARTNSITPYYCRDGRICGGRCRFNPCPAGDPWSLPKADWMGDWRHADPAKVFRDWFQALNKMTDAELANLKVKPRVRVKAGSRKVAL